MVVAEERPRVALQQSFSKLFKDIGLSPRAVSTTFGSRVNVAICLQVTIMKSCFGINGKGRCSGAEAPNEARPPGVSPVHLLAVGPWALYLDLAVPHLAGL